MKVLKLNLDHLNEMQRKAVREIDGPCLVVAGAGSGKTTVLTYRIAYLLQEGILPGQILALTFTNKAANEMKERIKKLVGEKAERLVMGTFHSIFARFLRIEAKEIGFSSDFTIYDAEDSQSLIKKIMEEKGLISTNFTPREVRNKISHAKNRLILPEEFEKLYSKFAREREVSAIYYEYQKRLKINNCMDFDDLLIFPYLLFKSKKEILSAYQDRFHYILVDEFQDTNTVQYRVLKMLAAKHKNLCVVGDDAQSIYKWRGADVTNILNFQTDFENTNVIRLEQNYRSTKNILNAANSVIANNVNQIKKQLWTRNETGEKVNLVNCFDDRSEAKYAVKTIEKLKQEGIRANKIAILYRLNSQSRIFEELFIDHSIPYIIVNGTEFYKRKEIKDAIAYLKLINNPDDSISFERIINFPPRGIGDKTLEKLNNLSVENNVSLYKAIEYLNEDSEINLNKRNVLSEFRAIIEDVRKKSNEMGLFDLVKYLFDKVGLLTHYLEDRTEEAIDRYENLVQLVNSIKEYSNNNSDKKLSDYLQEVSLLSDIDKWDNRTDAVNMMTLHSAKGLEFNTVFLVGCENGLLPLVRNKEVEDIEEERRLFYVGCTRAMKSLHLTFAQNRFRFGSTERQMKSPFLNELDDTCIQNIDFPPRLTLSGSGNRYASNSIGFDEFVQEMPDYENMSQENVILKAGTRVKHDLFGVGKVLSVSGYGDSKKVDVLFNNNIKKTLMVKFAKLKIIN